MTSTIHEVLFMFDESPVTSLTFNNCSISTGHIQTSESVPTVHPTPSETNPSTGFPRDSFCSKALPDIPCHCPGTGTGEGKKKGRGSQKVLLALSFLYLSNPFRPAGNAILSTVPQGQAILSLHQKANFQVFSV